MLLEKRAIEKIKTLSEDRLKTVIDFIEYLEEKESWEATLEVLGDKDSMKNIRAADDAWESGAMEEFVSWDKVKLQGTKYSYTKEQKKYIKNLMKNLLLF